MKGHIKLGPEDPTIFARCPNCCKGGPGVKVGKYYGRAFTLRRWKRRPKCENCKTHLAKLFEVE